MGLNVPHSQFGRFEEVKNVLRLTAFEPQTVQPVAYLYANYSNAGQCCQIGYRSRLHL